MRRNLKPWTFAVVAAAIIAAGIVQGTKTKAQYTALAPFETNATIGASATLGVLPANPSRRGLILCNGHASQSITVTFGTITPVSLTTGVVIPGGNTAASCFNLLPNILASPLVGVGAQVNAIASGATTPLTALEF